MVAKPERQLGNREARASAAGGGAPLRAVIDTNLLVGALVRPGGASDRILKQWRAGVFKHVASEATLREAESVVGSRWVGRLGGRRERDALLAELRAESIVVDAPILAALTLKDAGDRRLVGAAHAGRARYLVTADREVLLAWGHGGVEFLTAGEFLRALERSA
ncbi:MAG: putative toxin-antitoxin system toxin component, PIN family [Acidobacteria bacterium]|nr:putative toxin-antitoxin system toxin component, PIN family [Acidobacteriota bacterium]